MEAKNKGEELSVKLEGVLHQLQELKRSLESKDQEDQVKKKDFWDKVGIIGPLVAGIFIAGGGWLITETIETAQLRLATGRQFSDYLKSISEEKDASVRAALISVADLAVTENADVIAKHYALNDDSLRVRKQAIQVLKKNANGSTVLEEIANSDIYPSKHLAAAALNSDIKAKAIFARISAIDDSATLVINDEEILKLEYGADSGWKDVVSQLRSGDNTITFRIFNGRYGGWAGRLQLSSEQYQFDHIFERQACPCNAKALEINFRVVVDSEGVIKSWKNYGPIYFEAKK